MLGTADYLAPEQALDSHTVDIRADIYSLGATFYYLLTGKTPFGEGTVAQKLFWHQSRKPKGVRELRPDVPVAVEAIIMKMMAKDPAGRYQTPAELADALAPLTQESIAAPPENEMPRLSPAASGKTGEGSHHDANEATAISSKPETPRALQNMGTSLAAKPYRPAASPAPLPSPPVPPPAPHVGNGVKAAPPAAPPPPVTQPAVQSAVATQAAPSPAPEPAVEADPEPEFAWQALASETEELTAGADDTAPTKEKPPGGRLAAAGEAQCACATRAS